jgi:hypothetical protein
MHVELKAPANGQWPDFHIHHHANLRLMRGHRHRVTFWVSARPERELIDWAEFQQQAMSQCVCDLAHAVRTASGGRKLEVFFYGYLSEFAAAPTGPTVSGHYALRRVLDSPDIDVLCSPIS